MSRVMIGIASKDRPAHLKMCYRWLRESKEHSGFIFDFILFDDNSTNPFVEAFIEEQQIAHIRMPKMPTLKTAKQRLGAVRGRMVREFLEAGKYSALVMLDNDILVTQSTLGKALSDFATMANQGSIGAMTLHASGKLVENRRDWLSGNNGVQYGPCWFTGDAHMIIRRAQLETLGNLFGPTDDGIGDAFFKALRVAGLGYYTPVEQPLQVQHIGFGEGASSIHLTDQYKPVWTMRPYWTLQEPKRIIPVDGFDVKYYCNCVHDFGGAVAPFKYVEVKGITPDGSVTRQACQTA